MGPGRKICIVKDRSGCESARFLRLTSLPRRRSRGVVTRSCPRTNLVPRVFSLSNMAAEGEKTLAHSRNHVTDLSTESGNLFKMAAKIKSERIWVRGLETGEKQTKWWQRQNSKEAKNMKEYTYKPQEYGRMI